MTAKRVIAGVVIAGLVLVAVALFVREEMLLTITPYEPVPETVEEAGAPVPEPLPESLPGGETAGEITTGTSEKLVLSAEREHVLTAQGPGSAGAAKNGQGGPKLNGVTARPPLATANGHAAVARPAPAPSVESGVYKVELGADRELKIPGPPGEMRVWIGAPEAESHIPAEMARATDTLPAVGRTARITPFAPGFEVEPAQSVCLQIHPRGSSTRFQLIPKRKGTYKVGAEVHLFDSSDCSGVPIPQAVASLEVRVVVDRAVQVEEGAAELWGVFWDKLLEFWAALLALVFAALLFLLRKRFKKWFGYGDE